jgi:tetratricopeptide (TPR) repeat protein
MGDAPGSSGADHDIITNPSFGQQQTPQLTLEEAQELLASLPLDHVPQPQHLPTPHRMPLRPNPLFVGRVEELRTLAALLKVGKRTGLTTGIGGAGKTQLAVEVAYRYGHSFAGGVFWVSCADAAGIPGEIAACGLSMGLFPPTGVDLETQVRLTRAAWETAMPRLLIFDTCEDEQLLRRWLPQPSGCRVLVTSRRQSGWSPDLLGLEVCLGMLPQTASVELLQQLAPRLTAEEAHQIAEVLGNLPLALHLAGRSLACSSPTVPEYLARLASVQLQHPVPQEGAEALSVELEAHVARAFALSLDLLNVRTPTDDLARQLLARAACFAPDEPFRREWLEATVTPKGNAAAQRGASTGAVERLLELGLLETVGPEALRMHQLLAAAAAVELRDATALPAVEEVIGDVATRANDVEHPAAMQPVLAHLRYAVRRVEGREDAQAARLLNELGFFLQRVGNYAEAQPLLERALAIQERVLGEDDLATATSLNNLAYLLHAQGDYWRAVPLLERALAITERGLGEGHPATATSLSNLAELYRVQGDYERAMRLVGRALAIRERMLGEYHPDTAASLNNLAYLYRIQGDNERALSLYERALQVFQKRLGPQHPDTLLVQRNLAELHRHPASPEPPAARSADSPRVVALLRRLWRAIWR